MDLSYKSSNIETPVGRNRDLVSGSEKAKILREQYDKLLDSNDVELIGRVFRGYSGRFAKVSYANIGHSTQNCQHDHKTLVNLGSSDYAGLNTHPRVIKAATEALQKFGNSSTGGRLLNGTTELHVLLEQKLAEFLNMEAAITYNSGYCANLTVFSTLFSKNDIVISDILNHQSIIDGIKLGGAESITYLHNSVRGTARSIENLLQGIPRKKRKVIVTDGIFSMDGDVAPLDEIAGLAEAYDAFVVVDDAHAIGAFGPNGRGTVAHYRVEDKVDIITGVLSKGLPGIGGFVAGAKSTIDLLRFSSHGYIFSTALPPAVVAGLIEAIDILSKDASIQERLHRNVTRLKDGLERLGFDLLGSQSAVIPMPMPSAEMALKFARLLHDDGIYINAAIYPAVSPLRPRLRVNVNANLEIEDIDRALASIERCIKKLSLNLTKSSTTSQEKIALV